MPRISAGILLYRRTGNAPEVLLAHPGGPYWARKDDHAWSIPKGELLDQTEDLFEAACREFREEIGVEVVTGPQRPLSPLRQPGGKLVHAFAVEQDLDPAAVVSNTFTLEWPPRSGRTAAFPEIDRVAWFTLDLAATKILSGQRDFLDQLARHLEAPAP